MTHAQCTSHSNFALSGAEIRALMRSERISIVALSIGAGITQKRVRQVMEQGVCGFMAADWHHMITGHWPDHADHSGEAGAGDLTRINGQWILGGVTLGRRIAPDLYAEKIMSGRYMIRSTRMARNSALRIGEVLGANGRYSAESMGGNAVGTARSLVEAAAHLMRKAGT